MTHHPLPPFAAWDGPRQAKIVLVGEAWGQSEEECRLPFAGESGKELFRMLGEAWPEIAPEEHARVEALHRYGLAWVRQRQAWLKAAGVGLTNVLAFRPPGNNIAAVCQAKAELPTGYPWPAIERPGLFLRSEFLPELDRLGAELAECRPNLVVAMGNKACWALLQTQAISSIRGTVTMALLPGQPGASPIKCIPTFHPAAILRQWSWRVITVADLIKARREAQTTELVRPRRQILVSPTPAEIGQWVSETLVSPPPLLAVDIETANGQITCIGFARSRSEALVVPFVDRSQAGYSYWPSPEDEHWAWTQVDVLLSSSVPKVFQNGLYDLQYLLRWGLRPQACLEDTMLLHHSLFPELQKGLGFLGSIYTNESSWKLMRRKRPDSEKRDE